MRDIGLQALAGAEETQGSSEACVPWLEFGCVTLLARELSRLSTISVGEAEIVRTVSPETSSRGSLDAAQASQTWAPPWREETI